MVSGKLVRIAPETMEKLGKVAKPFETPNECINRLLIREPDVKGDQEDEEKNDE